MDIHILAVGRARRDPLAGLYEDYSKRLPWSVRLTEIPIARGRSAKERRREEGKAMLAALNGGVTLALESTGTRLSSEDFAARIATWRDSGAAVLTFIIGGPDGLDAGVRGRADFVLSLGPMTWSHLLVRAMLAEQLFRATSIHSGHPYHRGGSPAAR